MNAIESSDNEMMPDKELKIILIGAPRVGKTAIINKYVNDSFVEEYQPTETQYHESKDLTMESSDGSVLKVRLNCFDMGGEDTYREIRRRFMEGADGCIFTYSVDDPRSFMLSNNWIKDLREVCKEIPVMICANKVDINDRLVSRNAGEMLEYWFQSKYFETSAVNGENIEKMFSELTSLILERNH